MISTPHVSFIAIKSLWGQSPWGTFPANGFTTTDVAFPALGVILKCNILTKIIPPFLLLSLSTRAPTSVKVKYFSGLAFGVDCCEGFLVYVDMRISVISIAIAVVIMIHFDFFLCLVLGFFLIMLSPRYCIVWFG